MIAEAGGDEYLVEFVPFPPAGFDAYAKWGRKLRFSRIRKRGEGGREQDELLFREFNYLTPTQTVVEEGRNHVRRLIGDSSYYDDFLFVEDAFTRKVAQRKSRK